MSPRLLPHIGQIDIDDLAARIRTLLHTPRLLGSGVLRAVLVETGSNTWTTIANVVRFMPPSGDRRFAAADQESQVTMERLRLVSVPLSDAVLESGATLAAALTRFLGAPAPHITARRPSTSVSWRPGRNEWGHEPCWVVDYSVEHASHAGLPGGPFLHPETAQFFETLGVAAAWWTGGRTLKQLVASDQVLRLVVPDTRAYLDDIRTRGDTLEIDITLQEEPSALGDLVVALAGEDVHGRSVSCQSAVANGRAELKMDAAMKSIRLYLIGRNSQSYDMHVEREFGALSGESLFAVDRPIRQARLRALEEALAAGEGLHTEYKEWLPVNRDNPKWRDLLEAVVAFANAEGGAIYIGVDDRGNITGTDIPLRNEFRKEFHKLGNALEPLRELYVQTLRDRVLEGIRPRIVPDFQWVERDGLWVLQVAVPRGADSVCYIEATGECLIRRGATNRPASPPDIAMIEAGRRPAEKWPMLLR